jgi:hypothetical protein
VAVSEHGSGSRQRLSRARLTEEKVFIGRLEAYPEEKVQGILTRLGAVTETNEAVNVREVLKVLLPEFSEPVGEISSAYRIPGDVLDVTPARGTPRV